MSDIIQNQEYRQWFKELKDNIRQSQIKASISVNTELVLMYWDLGKQIVEKQENTKWGSGFIDQLSKDLKSEFPNMSGFSDKNLRYCRAFYVFYRNAPIRQQVVAELGKNTNSQQVAAKLYPNVVEQDVPKLENHNNVLELVGKIPWGHHILILQKIKNASEALFYVKQTIKNSWSRAILQMNIETDLYTRQGKAITNFEITLPKPQSDLANALIKDPYDFDFLELRQDYNERELENALTENITKFLLELGAGFAFVGKQYHLQVSTKDYYIDLLFYHLKLRSYVVIELKAVDFEPEFAGKLNFYLSAVDDLLRHQDDNPSIGIIICKSKDKIEAEYALRDINKPIGISKYELTKLFPKEFKGSLPTIAEIESELSLMENKNEQ
ncbi:MAG: PDDEXK nuclease domain-containing protein [bacterium]